MSRPPKERSLEEGSRLRRLRLIPLLCILLPCGGCSRTSGPAPAPARRPDILLISIDTLRADHLGAYGYPRDTSPFVDTLAARGEVFTNAVVPLPATDPSHASLLTSLHPLQHGVLANAMPLPDEVETIAEVLQRAGYFTMGAVAVAHLGRAYHFDQGFQLFGDQWDATAPLNNEHARSADDVNRDVFRMLGSYAKQRRGQPFFLFVHYFDVHRPYVRHKEYFIPQPVPAQAMPPSPWPWLAGLINHYDSEIRYVDDHISQLRERLNELGLGDNLLTCVTADHGEQLWEHGHVGGHADVYRETVRVPLIVEGPGITPGRIDETVSSMDTAVSLLERAGLAFSHKVVGKPILRGRWRELRRGGTGRPLLIVGHAVYTRSVGVIRDAMWYIRNLDSSYREVLEEDASGRPGSDLAPQLRPVPPLRRERRGVVFAAPVPLLPGKLRPVYVTAEVRTAQPACAAEVTLRIEPRLSYFARPIVAKGDTLIHYPAASQDTTSLFVRPEKCVAGVSLGAREFDEFARYRASRAGALEELETGLWRSFKTERKTRTGDELYDVSTDPGMLKNLRGAPELEAVAKQLDAEVDRLWAEHLRETYGREAAGTRYTKEQEEELKALGYIQ